MPLDLEDLIAFIDKSKVPYRDGWKAELRAGTMDAFSALLLTQLPHLKALRMAPAYSRETRYMGLVLRSALLFCGLWVSEIPTFT